MPPVERFDREKQKYLEQDNANYVSGGEVFIEERNNKWNTLYLFNAKALKEVND